MDKIQAFWIWVRLKIRLHQETGQVFFKEREVWWCSLGINIGDEEDGKNRLFERPVLIIKKISNRVLWIIPVGSMYREGEYYMQCYFNRGFSTLFLSQMRAVGFQRLLRKIDIISEEEFFSIRGKIRSFF